jgi:hypothetical protein
MTSATQHLQIRHQIGGRTIDASPISVMDDEGRAA